MKKVKKGNCADKRDDPEGLPGAQGCKRYALAITNYVLGQEIDVPEDELAAHLKGCKKCREEFTDWDDFTAALKTETHYSRPEVKSRWDRFIKKVVYNSESPTLPQKQDGDIDVKWEMGSAAGRIYQVLKENGEMSYPRLRDKTELFDFPFYEAIGWLGGQEKVALRRADETTYARLPWQNLVQPQPRA